MLVPFEINQAKVAELELKQHEVDWQRVRILKEIDDARYDAMIYGNIDLSMDVLMAMKKVKLFQLYLKNKKLAQAYDIPLQWFVDNQTQVNAFFDKNKLSAWKQKFIENKILFLSDAKREEYFMASWSNTSSEKYFAALSTETSGTSFSDDLYIAAATVFTNSYDVNTERESVKALSRVSVYEVKSQSIFNTLPDIIKSYLFAANVSYVVLKNVDEQIISLPLLLRSTIEVGVDIPAVPCFEPMPYPYKQGSPVLVERAWLSPVYNKDKSFSGTYNFTLADPKRNPYVINVKQTAIGYSQWYAKRRVKLANGREYDYVYSNFPFLGKSSKGKYTAADYKRNPGLPTSVNEWVWPPAAGRLQQDSYMSPYTTINGDQTFYNSRRADSKSTLQPYNIRTAPSTEMQVFMAKNKAQYSFPIYFPKTISLGTYRVRNGLLYSDASKFYQLDFVEYPQTILTQLEDLILQQEAIADLREDIEKKLIFPKRSVINSVTGEEEYEWAYKDKDIEIIFTHPITAKPVDAKRFLNELIFESAVLWDKVSKAIAAFLQPYKDENEAVYTQTYQAYLLGQATMKGPEAVAEYERKLKTGIFYYENGYEYWRAFTPLEEALLAQIKKNAAANANIEAQNKLTAEQNKYYQEQANLQIVMANNALMAEANSLAYSELKKIADAELSKIVAPTMEYLFLRADKEGGFASDALQKWVNENPYYYLRPDVKLKVEALLAEVTKMEQQVSTAMVADVVSEINFTKALTELFKF